MIVTHKDITKKTHLVKKGWAEVHQSFYYVINCGTGSSVRGNKNDSFYSYREDVSLEDIANENLCSKCFK